LGVFYGFLQAIKTQERGTYFFWVGWTINARASSQDFFIGTSSGDGHRPRGDDVSMVVKAAYLDPLFVLCLRPPSECHCPHFVSIIRHQTYFLESRMVSTVFSRHASGTLGHGTRQKEDFLPREK